MGLISKYKKYKWMIRLILGIPFGEKKRLLKGFKGASAYYTVPGGKIPHVDMKELLKCALCPNMCRFECPVLDVTRKETYAPATKARLMYHMERGNLSPSDPYTASVPYYCVNCNGCMIWCPMEISTGDLLRDVKADLVEKGIVLPETEEFAGKVTEHGNPFGNGLFISAAEAIGDVRVRKPEVLYYPGCVMVEKRPEAVKANIELLKKSGKKFAVFLRDRICCGTPLYTLGFYDRAREIAKANVRFFDSIKPRLIITDCPACAAGIGEFYKKLGVDHKYRVMTCADYYAELIGKGIFRPSPISSVKVTYHDPCYYIRRLNIPVHEDNGSLDREKRYRKEVFNEPVRFILSSIPGVELREPFRKMEETYCCGRGGVCHVHHPEISEAITRNRLKELDETGADIILSSCPSCEDAFNSLEAGKCKDFSEILLESLR